MYIQKFKLKEKYKKIITRNDRISGYLCGDRSDCNRQSI